MQDATLAQIDPATLTIGTNVRLDARLDKAFIASIRERGVLEPIVAYVEDDGADARTVVLYGQRRTVAATQAGRASVPVLIVPKPAEVDRLIDQVTENDHRVALTASERIGAWEQLAGLGLSAGQIAKRGARDKAEVQAALTVASSPTALQALEDKPLTIMQAAALAEFEDDEEAVKALLREARWGRFDHELQRRRDARTERMLVEACEADLVASGARVVPPYSYSSDCPSEFLTHLRDSNGEALDADAHGDCPGHAMSVALEWVTVDEQTGEPISDSDTDRPTKQVRRPHAVAVCADWRAHGHSNPYVSTTAESCVPASEMTEDERAAAKEARALVIRCNKEWESAETVRREWVRTFLTRKTAPKEAAAFIATVISHHGIVNGYQSGSVAADLLGMPAPSYGTPNAFEVSAQKATPARALVITLGIILGACEAHTKREHWRTTDRTTAYYLTTLSAWGYPLSEVEARANDTWTDPLDLDHLGSGDIEGAA